MYGGFTYTPGPDFNGADSFVYEATDTALNSGPVQVDITVNPVNDAPVAADDAYSTDYMTELVIDVSEGLLANDEDIDGDVLVVVTPSSDATIDVTDGSFTYTPAAGVEGDYSFTYEATDGDMVSNSATVTITVGTNPDTGTPPTTTGTPPGPDDTGSPAVTDTGGDLKGGGCNCDSGGNGPIGWMAFAPLLLIGLRRRS
jgi:MYXO-CTERM domain-containing protein